MTFTKEQLETLSQWEANFSTAVNSNWARNPGRINLRTIYDIYSGAVNSRAIPFNANCQHCIVTILRACGKLYFADKEELAKQEAAAKEVKAEDIPVKKVRAKVKTTSKKTKE